MQMRKNSKAHQTGHFVQGTAKLVRRCLFVAQDRHLGPDKRVVRTVSICSDKADCDMISAKPKEVDPETIGCFAQDFNSGFGGGGADLSGHFG